MMIGRTMANSTVATPRRFRRDVRFTQLPIIQKHMLRSGVRKPKTTAICGNFALASEAKWLGETRNDRKTWNLSENRPDPLARIGLFAKLAPTPVILSAAKNLRATTRDSSLRSE